MIRDDSGPSFARGYLDTADQRTSGKQELEETRGSDSLQRAYHPLAQGNAFISAAISLTKIDQTIGEDKLVPRL